MGLYTHEGGLFLAVSICLQVVLEQPWDRGRQFNFKTCLHFTALANVWSNVSAHILTLWLGFDGNILSSRKLAQLRWKCPEMTDRERHTLPVLQTFPFALPFPIWVWVGKHFMQNRTRLCTKNEVSSWPGWPKERRLFKVLYFITDLKRPFRWELKRTGRLTGALRIL